MPPRVQVCECRCDVAHQSQRHSAFVQCRHLVSVRYQVLLKVLIHKNTKVLIKQTNQFLSDRKIVQVKLLTFFSMDRSGMV
jgi:hypothetical protein